MVGEAHCLQSLIATMMATIATITIGPIYAEASKEGVEVTCAKRV